MWTRPRSGSVIAGHECGAPTNRRIEPYRFRCGSPSSRPRHDKLSCHSSTARVSPAWPTSIPPSGVDAATHSVEAGHMWIEVSVCRRCPRRRATTRSLAAANAPYISAKEPMRLGRPRTAEIAASRPRGCPPMPSATAISHEPSPCTWATDLSWFSARVPVSLIHATDTAPREAFLPSLLTTRQLGVPSGGRPKNLSETLVRVRAKAAALDHLAPRHNRTHAASHPRLASRHQTVRSGLAPVGHRGQRPRAGATVHRTMSVGIRFDSSGKSLTACPLSRLRCPGCHLNPATPPMSSRMLTAN